MTGYLIAPAAQQDLLEIIDYIAAENPEAAERVRDMLFDAFDAIADRPRIGHFRHDLTAPPPRLTGAPDTRVRRRGGRG